MLSGEQISSLASCLVSRAYKKNECLYATGNVTQKVMLIESGSVKIDLTASSIESK